MGDQFTPELDQRFTVFPQEIDEHLNIAVNTRNNAEGRAETTIRIGVAPGGPNLLSPAPPAPPRGPITAQAGSSERLRVGANLQAEKLLTKITPAYPPLAKQAAVQGTVSLTVTIAGDGVVKGVQLISGHPLLVAAATDAVRQWVYRPTLLNGQPVEVVTQVDVNFTLAQ